MYYTDDEINAKKASNAEFELQWSSWLKFPVYFNWTTKCPDLLSDAERRLMENTKTKYNIRYVPLRDAGEQIWTLSVDMDSQRLQQFRIQGTSEGKAPRPLLLLHGLGGGIGLWSLNLLSLSKYRQIYAIDLLGFGKSSRCHFSSNPSVAEIDWVESIEEWRISMGLECVYLLGHGLGAFLAASYALRYPNRVKRLIMVEPWGVAARTSVVEGKPKPLPFWVRAASAVARPFNPLISLRLAGPWATGFLKRLRPDLKDKFKQDFPDTIYEYVYASNARMPATGETALGTLSDDYGWAQNPMVNRIGRLPISIPISVINGARSWLDSGAGELIARARAAHLAASGAISSSLPVDSWSPHAKLVSGRVDVHVIPHAGHHVFIDEASAFNDLINHILFDDDDMPKSGVMY